MQISSVKVALLLFGSGLSALIYQVCWLRELRLVFGASTSASAAVLAMFMAGLGFGSAFLGKRADDVRNPLQYYAFLEALIAVYALFTPLLSQLVRWVYLETGGALAMGLPISTLFRLILSVGIVGGPAFLMGGTLPAAAKSVESDGDQGRRRLALLYGFNTLGAVVGAAGATFVLLDIFGTRNTIWIACLGNGIIAILARALSRSGVHPAAGVTERAQTASPFRTKDQVLKQIDSDYPARPKEIFSAAVISGFTFFLMELVWYRMLGAILGGTTYTFGLILATALLGIGIGGGLFFLRPATARPTIWAFAVITALEGFFLALPFALGDRIAIFTALISPLESMGFFWKIVSWSLIASFVVLPAAILSGFKFPLLIALLGKGGTHIGKHIGYAYAWNTLGAIVGSIAGGFGLLTLLTAPGCWKLVVYISAGVSLVAAGLSGTREDQRKWLALPLFFTATAMILGAAQGPTAVWRHSEIGTGRHTLPATSRNQNIDWMNFKKRTIIWEADGKEAGIGIDGGNGYAFVVNGGTDGNARFDAGTQVMAGLISALLHTKPEKAMVIGLGTGSTTGWLGKLHHIKRVDTVELEPSILEVARVCAPVNENALEQKNVNIIIGDAREVLMTTPERYDLIVSEPSNPYRVGIASLYTREFYHSVANRLTKGGIFSQWVQAYEISAGTIQTILATLASEFPYIEIWNSKAHDLILVCSKEPIVYPAERMRKRIATEPFRSALLSTWGVADLEGFLSRFVARSEFVKSVTAPTLEKGWLNTDDRMLIEFEFAKTVGARNLFHSTNFKEAAFKRGLDRPVITGGNINWDKVERNYLLSFINSYIKIPDLQFVSRKHQALAKLYNRFLDGDQSGIRDRWQREAWDLYSPTETVIVATVMAASGDRDSMRLIGQVREFLPVEADALASLFFWKTEKVSKAHAYLTRAFTAYRTDPWPDPVIMNRILQLTADIAKKHPEFSRHLFSLLSEPFSIYMLNQNRLNTLYTIAALIDSQHGREAIRKFEPHVPWQEDFLKYRYVCYRDTGDPHARKAKADYQTFMKNAGKGFAFIP